MKQLAMYRESLTEHIGIGVICQEAAIITEKEDGADVELYCTYRGTDGKCILIGDKTVRESDTFESGVSICRVAGFKPMEEIDRLVNFCDEEEIVYELENGEAIRMYSNGISKRYENADKAIDVVYRRGFRF